MKSLLLFCLIAYSTAAQAQTWDEWFKQRRTQRRYLIEQIAALNIYAGYAAKGYQIARQGLGLIRDIKQGDFKLHEAFFESMVLVSPRIRNFKKVASIIELQLKTVKGAKSAIAMVQQSGQFSQEEIRYCKDVVNVLLEDCDDLIDILMICTTDRHLKMKDNERIERIEQLYTEAQRKYSFCMSYHDELKMLSRQRLYQAAEVARGRVIQSIK